MAIREKYTERRDPPLTITLPGRSYEPVMLADAGYERIAVGLMILRRNQSEGIEVLMGKHRGSERSEEESGRWSWLAETVYPSELHGNIAHVLARLVPEEMDRGLVDLQLLGRDDSIQEADLVKEGRRHMVPIYVFATSQDLAGPLGESEEIEELGWFPLEPLIAGQVDESNPVREFTVSGFQQLAEKGVFHPARFPTSAVVIPPEFQVNGYKDSRSADLTKFRSK